MLTTCISNGSQVAAEPVGTTTGNGLMTTLHRIHGLRQQKLDSSGTDDSIIGVMMNGLIGAGGGSNGAHTPEMRRIIAVTRGMAGDDARMQDRTAHAGLAPPTRFVK